MGSTYSISSVISRRNKKRQAQYSFNESSCMYPLYKTSLQESTYNYENIRDAIYHWNSYSHSIGNNWSKVMQLFETVDKYGTPQQLDECATIINRDILPYFQSPSGYKKDLLYRLKESCSDHMKSHINHMIEILDEEIECDRVLTNFDVLSKRFNINKLISSNIFFEDAVVDTVYSLCSLIDTYNIDYHTKFCIAAESTLYSVFNTIGSDPIEGEYLKKKLNEQSLLETVFDYFLINYGRNHVDKFLDEMSVVCNRDPFVGSSLNQYINQLRKVQAQSYMEEVVPVEIHREVLDDSLYGRSQSMNDLILIRESATRVLHEFSLEEIQRKSEEALERIKLAPTQSVSLVKSAISSILVPCRAEDLAKGTHNALSTAFYALITLGAGITVGAFGLVLGGIASYIISKNVQKEYLKDAIKEWKDHKYSVAQKVKQCSDAEKKRRMEAYLEEVESTLAKLEAKYEESRDRTLEELNRKQPTTQQQNNIPQQPSVNHIKADINPSGLVTPTSSIYDKNKDHNVQLKNFIDDDSPKKKEED